MAPFGWVRTRRLFKRRYLWDVSHVPNTLYQPVSHIEWISPPYDPSGGKGNANRGGRKTSGEFAGPPEFLRRPRKQVLLKRLGLGIFHTPTVMLCAWYLPAVLAFVVLSWVVLTFFGTDQSGRALRRPSGLTAAFVFVVTAYAYHWLKQNTWYGTYYHWMERFLTWL